MEMTLVPFSFGKEKKKKMEPTYYTVQKLDGDYAILVSDDGVENRVVRALLPEETDEGVRLLCEFFNYTVVND